MDNQTASKILELMAIDLTGLLAGLPRRNPMVDVIEQRIEAINVAKNALSDLHKEKLPHGRWIFEPDGGTLCSVCNQRVRDTTGGRNAPVNLSELPYCPKCGAKMDEEETK